MASGQLVDSYRWHLHNSIYISASYNTYRPDGERDSNVTTDVSMSIWVAPSGPPYKFEVWAYTSVNGGPETISIFNYGQGNGNHPNSSSGWSDSQSISITQRNTGSAESIRIRLVCGQQVYLGYCSAKDGPYNFDSSYDNLVVPSYNPETPAHKATDGCVYSTNNTSAAHQSTISDYIHNQVWFDWWGQSNGTPEKNYIDYSNVDINTVNNVDGAVSIEGLTTHYTQNTRLNIYDVVKAKGLKPGGTLFCWVNNHTQSGDWLGRQYLGAIICNKLGAILYKDLNGNRIECTSGFIKETNGNKQTGRYALVKDTSGTQRVIDIYSSLY